VPPQGVGNAHLENEPTKVRRDLWPARGAVGILNSYSGIIVDEYQDCPIDAHRLIAALKAPMPCRVLGDELQAIFGFRDELVDWSNVRSGGELARPYVL
jgi:superfamily I DNA/RNA helicase